MISRRNFLKSTAFLTASFLLGCASGSNDSTFDDEVGSFTMPEESEPHERTWMAFVANDRIWSRRQIPEVKRNLALISMTIAKYEPVSMLVSPQDYDEAVSMLGGLDTHAYPIELIEFRTDDFWLRDTGPTFVRGDDGNLYGIDFNFNGWGRKQTFTQDAKVAGFITDWVGAIPQATDLVLEGGSIEVDGHGTALLTKSSVLNDNRNPHLSQAEVEAELKYLLGVRKIIWLDGIKGQDITDGHIDFYGRFAKKGQLLVARDNYEASFDYEVTRRNIAQLEAATDADGNPLELLILDAPDVINEQFGVNEFAAGYVGYYVCNNAVIMQSFGDRVADENAKAVVAQAYPDRTIEQIRIDGIASGGGSIHCATQQQPLLNRSA